MADFITPDDLLIFVPTLDEAKAAAMIADVTADALRAAPCLAELDPEVPADAVKIDQVRAILRGALLRWAEGGTAGSVVQQQAGIFGMTTTNDRRRNLYPSEITDLQGICGSGGGKSFTIDATPSSVSQWQHAHTCSAYFGGSWCDCGADINGGIPLWP